MTHGNIIESLPRLVNNDQIQVDDEAHTYTVLEYEDGTTSTKTRYTLDKAPVDAVKSVSAQVDGTELPLVEGDDYDVVDDNNDGRIDSIEFGVGGVDPDPNTEFYVTYRCVPIIRRYTEGHEEAVNDTGNLIQEVIESHQVENASGDSLDALGAFFGDLGLRRGRNDQEYRAYLKSIVQSFSGRGTKPGLKFAVASGIGTDIENITITEDFEEVGYEIRVEDTESTFISSVINELADLADPSGVELLSDPIILLDGTEVIVVPGDSSQIGLKIGLGGDTLTLDGNSTLRGTLPSGGGTPSTDDDPVYDLGNYDTASYDATVTSTQTYDGENYDEINWL